MRHIRRHIEIALSAGALILLSGCNSFPWSRGNTPPPQAAQAPSAAPSKEAVIAYLNDNAQRVESIQCKEMDIVAKQGTQSVGLRATMVCAKPRGFRLLINVMGKPEGDIGSNDQEFWFWIARDESHRLYHCSYEDLSKRQVPMPFPFQPEWITEAMGVAPCGAPEKYELVVRGSTLELVENAMSPQGQPVRKVTVIQRTPSRGTEPQVTAHILQDAQGREIVSAQITEVQIDRKTGAIIPRKVRLSCPAEKMELQLKLDDVVVNSPTVVQNAPRMFARPQLSGATLFDLARGPDPANGVQPIGHQRIQ
jgi:hypothetical protein